MVEVTGNLWTYPTDYRVITTNGTVRKDGGCVMGRGCALEATKKFPNLQKELGKRISEFGNIVHFFPQYSLFSFPVKHNWYEKADLDLIAKSAIKLADWTNNMLGTFLLPRPGCGNGQRTWEEVKPLLECLSDQVKIITF